MESTNSANTLSPEDIKLHEKLLEQPRSFFEREPFELEGETIAVLCQDVVTDMTLIPAEYEIEVDNTAWLEEAESERRKEQEAWKVDDLLGDGGAESSDDQDGYVFSE